MRPGGEEPQRESARRDEAERLLAGLEAGQRGAGEALLPLLYEELRAQARRQMRQEGPGHTLQTTALVHEAYLRLAGRRSGWESKAHFVRVAAQAMRRVLIDHARRKRADKRGGERTREPLDQVTEVMEEVSSDLLAVDEALEKLSEIDERMAQVVEVRFFGGLTVEETARVMGVSPGTVKNDWTLAKAWLKAEVTGG